MTRQDTLYILSALIKILLSDRFFYLELRVILPVLSNKVIGRALFVLCTVSFFIPAATQVKQKLKKMLSISLSLIVALGKYRFISIFVQG